MSIDAKHEFNVLVHTLEQRKRFYLTLIADGYTTEQAAQKIGLKPETIRQTWKWSRRDGDTFRRCLSLIEQVGQGIVEDLKRDLIKQETLNAVLAEIAEGWVDARGNRRSPRSDTMRLGAEMSGLVHYNPMVVGVQNLQLIIQNNVGRLQEAAMRQLAEVNGLLPAPHADPVEIVVTPTSETPDRAPVWRQVNLDAYPLSDLPAVSMDDAGDDTGGDDDQGPGSYS